MALTLTATGRQLAEPTGILEEAADANGLKHTVVAFNETFRGHSALTTGVDLIASFMQYPMVTGLVECRSIDTEAARFAYPTGTIWTIKEVLRGFDQVGQPVGVRAALELCYLAGMVLYESGDTGKMQGCFSHGNVNPYRIGLKADGELQVFGYGLPQVDMLNFLSGGEKHIDDVSILYAPPERLEGQPEQPSSDTYSLTVLAAELIVGRPLFDGLSGQKLWDSVKLAQGVQRMLEHKKIPKRVRDVLANALVYDPDTRLQDENYIAAIGELLDDPAIEGRTLREVMLRMRQQRATGTRKLVSATATSAFTPADLAALAAAQEEDDDVELEEVGEERWGRTTGRRRSRRRAEPEEPRQRRRRSKKDAPEAAEATAPEVTEEAEESPSRRRRRRKPGTEPAAKREALPTEDPPTDADLTEHLVAAPEPTEEAPAAEAKNPEPEKPKSEAPKPEKPSEEAEPPRRRRRSKRAAAEGKSKAEAKVAEVKEPSAAEPAVTASEAPAESPDSAAKPRRRRATAAPSEAAADPPPRRRRRRPDGDAATSPDADGATGSEGAPKRRRRRRTKDADTE